MCTILAIDPAWTENNPSGVVLIKKIKNQWTCLALAPSYQEFYDYSAENAWNCNPHGSIPCVQMLLNKARELAQEKIDIVVIDMPLSTLPITGRRNADSIISISFGRNGCAAHSPNALRPGALGANIIHGFNQHGYRLSTILDNEQQPTNGAVLETYPHPVLLDLLSVNYRFPYKVGNRRKYWPNLTPPERIKNLIQNFNIIKNALSNTIANIPEIPWDNNNTSIDAMKSYEDSLDALVCAWVGIVYLDGNASCQGDENSAIWLPNAAWEIGGI